MLPPLLPPVRCFTCGHVVGDCFATLVRRRGEGDGRARDDGVYSSPYGHDLDALGIRRLCCRSTLLGQQTNYLD